MYLPGAEQNKGFWILEVLLKFSDQIRSIKIIVNMFSLIFIKCALLWALKLTVWKHVLMEIFCICFWMNLMSFLNESFSIFKVKCLLKIISTFGNTEEHFVFGASLVRLTLIYETWHVLRIIVINKLLKILNWTPVASAGSSSTSGGAWRTGPNYSLTEKEVRTKVKQYSKNNIKG